MKQIRLCMFAMLLALSVFALTGCSRNKMESKNQANPTGTAATSSAAPGGTGTNGTSTSSNSDGTGSAGSETTQARNGAAAKAGSEKESTSK